MRRRRRGRRGRSGSSLSSNLVEQQRQAAKVPPKGGQGGLAMASLEEEREMLLNKVIR